MSLFSDKDKAARAELCIARQELGRVARASGREETNEFLAANDRVARAEKKLPWHKRIDIDLTNG